MPIVYEYADSPEITWAANGKSARARRKIVVLDITDEAAALSAALSITSLVILIDGEPCLRSQGSIRPTGYDSWLAEFEYVPDDQSDQTQQRPQPGTFLFRVDATGGSQKVTYSKKPPLHAVNRTGTDPAPKIHAVGWDGENVNGVELPWPQLKFEIEGYYRAQDFTTDFAANLARNVPRKNKKKYLGFEPGELLYLGPTGQGEMPTINGQRVRPVTCVHHFAASENTPAFTLGGGNYGTITIPAKKGWDVLSVYFEPTKSPTEKWWVPVPKWAWIHELIFDADFAQLLRFGGPAS